MLRCLSVLLLISVAQGAEFTSGQAARAVLGQSSFSSREAGVSPSAMTISDDRLYVANDSHETLTFDLTKIPAVNEDLTLRRSSPSPLSGFAPESSIAQQVAPGSSLVTVYGKTLAAIDARTHRILLWKDATTAAASVGPDVTLSIATPETAGVSESTLIDPISIALDGRHLFVGDAALHRVLVWKSLPSVDNQPADFVLGQRDFSSKEASDLPRADSINRPDTLVSDGVNLFVADSFDRRILVFSPADLALSAKAITNSASLAGGSFAPGTLITLTGGSLADTTVSSPDDGTQSLPVKLAGTEVFLNGVALPLLSVSPTEIRAQLPYGIGNAASASLYVREEHADGSVTVSNAMAVSLASSSLGLFAFAGTEPRPAILLHDNVAPASSNATPVSADAPAVPGEIVTLWATGLHLVTGIADQGPVAGVPYGGPEITVTPIHALVNGQPAEVLNATLPPTSVGIYQVKVMLPSSIQPATAQLSISQDGVNSNSVTFPIRKSSF